MLAGLGVLMTALSAAAALNIFPDTDIDVISRVAGAVGTLFFALCTVIWLRRTLSRDGAMLTISSQGICDRRIAAETIPWAAVRRISTWAFSGQRILVLDVDPAVEATLHLSAIAKWSRGANRVLGADGLCVTAHGLKIGYDQLFDLVRQHVPEAHA
jgi:hypothetical protein